MKESTNRKNMEHPPMSVLEFAHLGDGEVAYIRSLNAEEAARLFPTLEALPEGIVFYSLHAADGTPLALTDSRAAAIANALEHDLHPVSVH